MPLQSPTIKGAEEVYQRLFYGLGNQFEVWTSDHRRGLYGTNIDKSNLMKVPFFVGCHAFLIGLANDPMRFFWKESFTNHK